MIKKILAYYENETNEIVEDYCCRKCNFKQSMDKLGELDNKFMNTIDMLLNSNVITTNQFNKLFSNSLKIDRKIADNMIDIL